MVLKTNILRSPYYNLQFLHLSDSPTRGAVAPYRVSFADFIESIRLMSFFTCTQPQSLKSSHTAACVCGVCSTTVPGDPPEPKTNSQIYVAITHIKVSVYPMCDQKEQQSPKYKVHSGNNINTKYKYTGRAEIFTER